MSTARYVEVVTYFDSITSKGNYQEYIKEQLLFMHSFNCRICLWEFESELHIHNYLEHLITNHIQNKSIEALPFTKTDPIL